MKNEEKNTEQAILQAAEALFLKQGFAQTTTKQIAQQAGCNQALVHYYFRTKDNLFERILEEKVHFVADNFSAINAESISLEERIEKLVEVHFTLFNRNPRLVPFIFTELFYDTQRLRPVLVQIRRYATALFARFDALLQQEARAGHIRPVTTLDLTLTIISLDVAPFMLRPVAQEAWGLTDEQAEQLLAARKREIVDTLLHSLGLR